MNQVSLLLGCMDKNNWIILPIKIHYTDLMMIVKYFTKYTIGVKIKQERASLINLL